MNNTLKWILIAVVILGGLAFAGYKMIAGSGILDAVNPAAIEKMQSDVAALKAQNADFKACAKAYTGSIDDMAGVMKFTMWTTTCSSEIPPSAETCALVPSGSELEAVNTWAKSFCTEIASSNVEHCAATLAKVGPKACNK